MWGWSEKKADGFIKVHPSVHNAHAIENENSNPEAFRAQCILMDENRSGPAGHAHYSSYVFTARSPPYDPIVQCQWLISALRLAEAVNIVRKLLNLISRCRGRPIDRNTVNQCMKFKMKINIDNYECLSCVSIRSSGHLALLWSSTCSSTCVSCVQWINLLFSSKATWILWSVFRTGEYRHKLISCPAAASCTWQSMQSPDAHRRMECIPVHCKYIWLQYGEEPERPKLLLRNNDFDHL